MDLTVICVNNFTYGMTGGQVGPTSPLTSIASTAPYGCYETPFNLPLLAESCGAVYVARWTTYHVTQLAHAMRDALLKKGFAFVEVISPCPTLFLRRNKRGDVVDEMQYYKERSVRARPGTSTRDVALTMDGDIMVGTFVNIERPSYLDQYNAQMHLRMGDRYVPYGTDQPAR